MYIYIYIWLYAYIYVYIYVYICVGYTGFIGQKQIPARYPDHADHCRWGREQIKTCE